MFDSADSIEKAAEHEMRVIQAKVAWSMLLLLVSISNWLPLTHVPYLLTGACHYKEEMIRSGGKDFKVLTVFLSRIQFETPLH